MTKLTGERGGNPQAGEAQIGAAAKSEIHVETFAEAIVSALERRCLNGPLPPLVRQRFIAGLKRRNPDLPRCAGGRGAGLRRRTRRSGPRLLETRAIVRGRRMKSRQAGIREGAGAAGEGGRDA